MGWGAGDAFRDAAAETKRLAGLLAELRELAAKPYETLEANLLTKDMLIIIARAGKETK